MYMIMKEYTNMGDYGTFLASKYPKQYCFWLLKNFAEWFSVNYVPCHNKITIGYLAYKWALI